MCVIRLSARMLGLCRSEGREGGREGGGKEGEFDQRCAFLEEREREEEGKGGRRWS